MPTTKQNPIENTEEPGSKNTSVEDVFPKEMEIVDEEDIDELDLEDEEYPREHDQT